jgi:hypothetical protein
MTRIVEYCKYTGKDVEYEVTLIVTKSYGSEGSEPLKGQCPSEQGVSCVSGSGSSMCGHYMGHETERIVRCTAKRGESAYPKQSWEANLDVK